MEYRVELVDMPTTIRSFVERQEGYDTIVINARLSSDQQRECFEHEVGHIGNGDLDKEGSADSIEVTAHGRI